MDEDLKHLLTLGKSHYHRGEYGRAERYLAQVVEQNQSFADVYNMLGVIYHDQGQFAKARRAFEGALRLNPSYTEAALNLAVSAWQSYHFLGSPEGGLALAEATVYLATAPKSNRAYRAWKAALDAAGVTGSAPVPLHLRNAPTKEMKEWGYGEGYRYDPDEADGVSSQDFLPESIRSERFYEPGPFGFERDVRKRMEWWAARRERKGAEDPATPGEDPAEG